MNAALPALRSAEMRAWRTISVVEGAVVFMAEVGHAHAHAPQFVQSSESMERWPSERLMASCWQAVKQLRQRECQLRM